MNKFLILQILIQFIFVESENFLKNLDINIQFPPLIERKENIPTGHLRPLGWQVRSDGPIHEESVTIRPDQFWNTYVLKQKPTALRGLVFGAEAIDKWSDSYLNREFGHLDIKVTERKQRYDRIEEKKIQMKFKNFLRSYRTDDMYLETIVPFEILNEVPMPQLVNCGVFVQSTLSSEDLPKQQAKLQLIKGEDNKSQFFLPKLAQLIEPYLWMSAGDTSSLIHSHPEHNLHCVLDGRKDFILIPSGQFEKYDNWRSKIELYETYEHSGEWYSKVDVDKVNAFKYKLLTTMKWQWATIRAGDCVFIPANYLHQMRSHGRSISSSTYFTDLKHELEHEFLEQIKSKLFSECPTNAPLFEAASLFSEHFLWKYTHSERHLVRKSDLNENDSKHYLFCLISSQDSCLYFERWNHFYQQIIGELKENVDQFNVRSRDLISLNSTDIWMDFLAHNNNDTRTQNQCLSKANIYNLKVNQSLNRFIQILKISADFHDANTGKEEL